MSARRLSADWLLPVEGAPVRNGALLIGSDGRIAAVGPEDSVPSPPGIPSERFDGSALIPGLVNTHTHLELTGLAGRIDEPDFPRWIRRLRELKLARTSDDFLAAARIGLADCHAAGVTTVADTGDSGMVAAALAETGGSGIAFHEVFGPHPVQVADSMAGLADRMRALQPFASDRVRLGVSPHAPYTVSGPLYAASAAWARSAGYPLAVHVAESPEECALLRDGSGAFAEAWARRGIPVEPVACCTPVEWLARHGVLGPDTLCIHVVHASAADIARLASAGTAVAHCPLSNRAHAHGTSPVRALLDAGLRVGIGTDSVASVGTLDLMAEVRAAAGIAGLDAEAALRLCTIAAAEAIGLAADVGSLVPGKWGDVAVMATGMTLDPVAAVVSSQLGDVRATYLGGRQVYGGARAGTPA